MGEIKRLKINYKTGELSENFKVFDNKNLYVVDELNGQMTGASSDSPFYGVSVGD